jgi:hypothetical protein
MQPVASASGRRMKILKWIFTIIGTMFAGMFGGQKNKATRRFGIPGLAVIMAWTSGKFKWKHLAFLLFCPILIMGYGEHSILYSIFHNDTIVRIVYGAILALPFIVFGLRRWICAMVLLVIAFSIRAGSFGTINGFDILIEDIIRYGVLGVLIAFNIFVDKK